MEFYDIMNFSYPNPESAKDFPDRILRAAQFAPFAALTGYEDAISETARITDKKTELGEDENEELDRRFSIIRGNIESLPEVKVTYFVPDERKEGGEYVTKKGNIKKVCEYTMEMVFCDGIKVPLWNILRLEGELFDI